MSYHAEQCQCPICIKSRRRVAGAIAGRKESACERRYRKKRERKAALKALMRLRRQAAERVNHEAVQIDDGQAERERADR